MKALYDKVWLSYHVFFEKEEINLFLKGVSLDCFLYSKTTYNLKPVESSNSPIIIGSLGKYLKVIPLKNSSDMSKKHEELSKKGIDHRYGDVIIIPGKSSSRRDSSSALERCIIYVSAEWIKKELIGCERNEQYWVRNHYKVHFYNESSNHFAKDEIENMEIKMRKPREAINIDFIGTIIYR